MFRIPFSSSHAEDCQGPMEVNFPVPREEYEGRWSRKRRECEEGEEEGARAKSVFTILKAFVDHKEHTSKFAACGSNIIRTLKFHKVP